MAYSSLSDLRTARNTRLASTDYVFLFDNKDRFDPIYLELIRTYREALRNITNGVTSENVDKVTLPDEPVMV